MRIKYYALFILFSFSSTNPMFYYKYLANAAAHPTQSVQETVDYFNRQSLRKQFTMLFSVSFALSPIATQLISDNIPTSGVIASLAGITTLIGITAHELRKLKAQCSKDLCRKAKLGQLDLVKTLLDSGADPNYNETIKRFSPLHYAAKERHLNIMHMLLEYGANIDAQNLDGLTPLMCLVEAVSQHSHEHPELIEEFIKKKPNLEIVDHLNQSTALLRACDQTKSLVAIPLLEAGANINAKDKYGDTPLHWVTFYGNQAVIMQLLARGADKTIKDNNDHTPIFFADTDETKKVLELKNIFKSIKKREIGKQVKF